MGSAMGEVLFGPGSTPRDWALGVLFIALQGAVFVFIGWTILRLLRASRTTAKTTVERIVETVQANTPATDDRSLVKLQFTVYTMFLLWGTQTSVQVRLPYGSARAALGKMLRHNLAFGWFGPGGVFVPILTTVEYVQQRRSLARQERQRQEGATTETLR